MSYPIVCAALRHESGDIICGARHFDRVMVLQIQRDGRDWRRADQGFIDTHGEFLSRETAWVIASFHDQIVGDSAWNYGRLHSEHLY
jgi:hypothetical protein